MSSPSPPRSIAYLAIARSDEVLQRLPISHSAWLSPSEQCRLQTLRVAQRRDHYLAGHWLVRELLGHALLAAVPAATRPEHWSLLEIWGQAPQVFDHPGLHVSISHSGDWIAAAVANHPLGIDLEQRPRALDPAIRDLLLNPSEAPADVDNDELLQRWVVKEAWLKMRGTGALPDSLRQLQLHATDADNADVIHYQNNHFHFAVTTAWPATLNWRGDANAIQTNAYRLESHEPLGA
ncbi:MAG: 4'-phosphopantetheinyl transferase family protein [Pseudomarimonas sp.]